MTIKPIVNEEPSKEKETHGHNLQEQGKSSQQNISSNNGRSNLRNKSSQPPLRNDVFEDITRIKRNPHKVYGRSKRDHKREQRDGEKLCSSPSYQAHSNSGSSLTSAASGKSPKHASTSSSLPANIVLSSSEDSFSGYNSGDEHVDRKVNLLTPDEWKNRDEQFAKAMSERGFVIKDIVEDGACLFRAISLQIYGDQEMHEVIRQQTMDYIYKNREYYTQFVTEDINSYLKRKRKKDSHGNHIEIQAISELYNRAVELYCYQTEPINIFNLKQSNNGYDPFRLSYQRGSHYNAILDPYNASVGVGLGLAGYKPESQTLEAIRLSEQLEIEKCIHQTMFEDKLKTTDWEATNEVIEEQIARESYIQWCRDMQKARKASQNCTSSTVTSAEAQINNNCESTSCNETTSKESLQFNNKNDSVCDTDQSSPLPKTSKTLAKEGSKIEGDTDDTDKSSTSSVDQYSEKHFRLKSKVPTSRQPSRRRFNEMRLKRKLLSKWTINKNDKEPVLKRSKMCLEIPKNLDHEARTKRVEQAYLPCTSKQAKADSSPVSTFYQSLLESSYADDDGGQLTENEMLQKAIAMSQMDFIEEQKRKFAINKACGRVNTGDEDSDTLSQ